jgi:hypothetical protein
MPDDSTDNSTHNRRSPAEHLKPHWFKPGESGNPGGRPKKPIKERLLQRLREDDAVLADLVEAILAKARTGDVQAFNSIRDTIEGRPVQAVESTGSDGGEIQSRLLIKFVDAK